MNTRNLKVLLKKMVEEKILITPMLWGRHGLGKSAVVHQLGKELGYKVLTIILSQKEAVDLSGMLFTFEDPELGMSVTDSHPPKFFADAVTNGKVIIFLDEFNMARREVLNAAFELVLDRRLNNKTLPDDVFIICAGNPDDERYDTTPLSESLRDRLMHIQMTFDIDAWSEWARGSKRVNSAIIDYLQVNPSAANAHDDRDLKFPVEIKHSNRSWAERLSPIYDTDLPEDIKVECYKGIIGPEQTIAFLKHLKENQEIPLTSDQVLAGKYKKKIKQWTTENRLDLLKASTSNVAAWMKENHTDLAENLRDSVLQYMLEIPMDMMVSLVNQTHEFGDWSVSILENKKVKTAYVEAKKLGVKVSE